MTCPWCGGALVRVRGRLEHWRPLYPCAGSLATVAHWTDRTGEAGLQILATPAAGGWVRVHSSGAPLLLLDPAIARTAAAHLIRCAAAVEAQRELVPIDLDRGVALADDSYALLTAGW